MFRRIIFAAALAGLIAGVFATAFQWLRVIPLILEAETYEAAAAATAGHDHDATVDEAAAEEWSPADGVERTFYTLLFNVLTGIGFALLLGAAFAMTGESNWRRGVYWGLAGFATFMLAPALGLPAEIPGAAAAPLIDRQMWWLATVSATGLGLALMFRTRGAKWIAAGAVLIAAPHLIGAPQPADHGGLAPEGLARDFAVAALVSGFLFWLVLGALSGFLYERLKSH
ncbi:MAG: CbtA family protein [Dongiaceae bacterium]